jgi:HSP20 family protein
MKCDQQQNVCETEVVEQAYETPPVNICETADSIVVEAEMPGVDKSRLEVFVDGDQLLIVGKRMKKESAGEAVWREIPEVDYRRGFTLGDHIDRSKIQAKFDSGILKLTLAKAEAVKPRKIEVDFK